MHPKSALLCTVIGFGLLLSGHLNAEEASKAVLDKSIEAQLDGLGYEYEVDEDNDFKLVFEIGDKGRSQIVYVLSAVETYGSHRVREVWSPAYRSETDSFPAPIANRLLEASHSAKMGGWVKQGRNAVFVVKIKSDASKEELDDALDLAMQLADEMENELTPGQDEL